MIPQIGSKDNFGPRNQIWSNLIYYFWNEMHPKFWTSYNKFTLKYEIASLDGFSLLSVPQKTTQLNELKFCIHLFETIKNGYGKNIYRLRFKNFEIRDPLLPLNIKCF